MGQHQRPDPEVDGHFFTHERFFSVNNQILFKTLDQLQQACFGLFNDLRKRLHSNSNQRLLESHFSTRGRAEYFQRIDNQNEVRQAPRGAVPNGGGHGSLETRRRIRFRSNFHDG